MERAQQTRSFCYVSDEIEGILGLSRSDEHLPVNVGNPTEWTILECAKAVLRVTGSKSEITYCPLPQDDPVQRNPISARRDDSSAGNLRSILETGLKLSLDYFRSVEATT